jgi:hypothetical protein
MKILVMVIHIIPVIVCIIRKNSRELFCLACGYCEAQGFIYILSEVAWVWEVLDTLIQMPHQVLTLLADAAVYFLFY